MDYTLRYTKKALNDLDEILGRIAEDDNEAASRFGGSLLDHIDLLAASREWAPGSENAATSAS